MPSHRRARTNWRGLSELPVEHNPLFTTHQAFKKELLPLSVTEEATVKFTCLICTRPSRIWTWERPARDHSQTSNLWRHLKAKHKSHYDNFRCGDQSESEQESIATTSSSITRFTVPTRTSAPPEEVRRLIIEFIISNNLPFRVTRSQSFRALISRLYPDSVRAVNIHDVSAEIKRLYHDKLNLIRTQLADHKKFRGTFALCIDAWTTQSQHAFLGVTIHWVNSQWKLNNHVLRLIDLKKRHTGAYIESRLSRVLTEFGIKSSILTVTMDNASNNRLFFELFSASQRELADARLKQGIWCLAHVLNLIVQALIKPLGARLSRHELERIQNLDNQSELSDAVNSDGVSEYGTPRSTPGTPRRALFRNRYVRGMISTLR